MTENFNPLQLVYTNTMGSAIKYAKTNPELQQYVEKLIAFKDNIINKLIKVFSRDESSFNILNHGDLWINNLMFSGDDSDVILVDYQEGYYGSPGIDLNWFIYTSCNQDVITNNFDQLLQYYHTTLIDTLDKLKYNKTKPTLQDIKTEIQKKGDHGLATLLCMTAIFVIENKEHADACNFISDSEECERIRDQIFSHPVYGQILINNLPTFVSSGHL